MFRYVINNSHPWMFFVIIVCFHWSWTLGIAEGMMSDRKYQLSYGQVGIITYVSKVASFSSELDSFSLFSHSTPNIGFVFVVLKEKVPICIHQSYTQVLLRRNTLSRFWLR